MGKESKNLNELRKNRIFKIKSLINELIEIGGKCSYNKVIAEFCISEGLSRRTVKEYVDLLVDSGKIIKKGDKLS